MEAIEEIHEIIEWYRELPSDYTGINELMYQRQRLVGFCVLFSGQMGYARKLWVTAKSNYEKKKMQLRVSYQSKGTTKANSISRANSINEYEDMQNAEGNYYKMYYAYRSFEEVLSSMSQQIAYLREELKKANFQNG